jgi:hypothetical protein
LNSNREQQEWLKEDSRNGGKETDGLVQKAASKAVTNE